MDTITVLKKMSKLDILIVEDGDDIREIISSIFNKICHVVTTAIDGEDGLKKFRENKPDFIISDIRMPNMNGNTMVNIIKKEDPNIPIIIITGHGKMIKATNKADVILEKPIKFDQLLENIYTLIK
jgi:DNA-binding NtrC family response regulator